MKNYRVWVPIILIVLMVAASYSMVSDAIAHAEEVEALLSRAEECSSQGLFDKSAGYYADAIAIDKNVDHYISIIDMYYEGQQYESSKEWCETALDTFPEEVAPYERMLRVCIKLESYADAYDTLETFDGRGFASDKVDEYRSQMKYLYYVDSSSFEDVTQNSSGYVGFLKKQKWGLASEKGSIKVSAKFKEIGYFSNDIVPVLDFSDTWYFMNPSGEYTFNISNAFSGKVTKVGLYSEGLVSVCVDNKYVFYNMETGKQFGQYDYAGTFSSGVAAVKEGKGWYLINSEGKHINKEPYLDIILDDRGICCQQDRIFVKLSEDGYSMINSKAEKVGTEVFDSAKVFDSEDYAAILVGELWGFVDTNGSIAVEPKYDNANSYSFGLAAILEDELWGYIDVAGKFVIEPGYTEALNFSDTGTAYVKDENNWSVIKLYQYNY